MESLVLDIKSISSTKGSLRFTVRIVEQRLRGSKAFFIASNGFKLSSLSYPAIGIGYNADGGTYNDGLLYLRGSARSNDNDIIETASVGYIDKLKKAVLEYNIAMEEVL